MITRDDKSSRQNIRYPKSRNKRGKRVKNLLDNGSYSSMFIEDFSRLVPYKNTNNGYQVLVQGLSKKDAKSMSNCFKGFGGYDGSSVEDSFMNFINGVASNILANGESLWEVVYLKRDDLESFENFSIEYIMYEKKREKKRDVLFTIPDIVASEHEVRNPIAIKKDYLYSFPSAVRFYKDYKIAKKIRDLKKYKNLDIVMEATQNNDFSFDQTEFFKASDLGLARATGQIQWDARGAFRERTTDYYRYLRKIEYKKFKRVFMDAIVEDINELLEKVGRKLGFECKIYFEGIPTVAELNDYEAKLRKGKIGFSELNDVIYF